MSTTAAHPFNEAVITRVANEAPESGSCYNSRSKGIVNWSSSRDLKNIIRRELRFATKAQGYENNSPALLSTNFDGKRYNVYADGTQILELNIPTCARVHRYHDSVAVHVGSGETTYLSPKNARRLATALLQAAKSVETEKFSESNVPNTSIFGTNR
jgi:hypothetical protein